MVFDNGIIKKALTLSSSGFPNFYNEAVVPF